MNTVSVQTLGLPNVIFNGERIFFPYKKCEALFYYLACERSISREEACNLLWEEENEETAKKNLRHALYMIKKVFGCDMVISPVKSSLILNPEINISVDLNHFFDGDDVAAYEGEFLRGFVVKNAFNYTQWVDSKAEQIRSYYLSELLKKIQHIPTDQIAQAEVLSAKYIEKDPLDERIYEEMLKKYDDARLYHKGIQLYKKLYKILNDEVGIDPNHSIQDIYYSMLNHWSANEEIPNDEQVGVKNCRQNELEQLKYIYTNFKNGKSEFVLVSGESGVGKSYILNEFLQLIDQDQMIVFKAPSFSIEQNNPLQTWNFLLMQVDEYIEENKIKIPVHYIQTVARLFPTFGMSVAEDMDISIQSEIGGSYGYLAAKNCIIRIFSLISKTKLILLVFDDLQYMDTMSLDLLSSLILSQNDRILILSSCQDEMSAQAEQFISGLIKNHMLKRISLKRFSFEETCVYLNRELGGQVPDTETLHEIYRNTEGIPFFLAEVAANYRTHGLDATLSKNTQNVLNDRLNSISPETRQLVDVLSIFKHSVTLDILLMILNKTESEILHITDDFKYNSIVDEQMENGKVVFAFKHNKMHEFVYSRLSLSKKRILHNRAGYAYETIYAANLKPYYKRMAYHFRIGENMAKSLEYQILDLEQNTNLLFDLYPILDSKPEVLSNLSPTSIEDQFHKIEKNLHSIKSSPEMKEIFEKLESRLLHARSSFCILRGKYEDGIKYTDKLLNSPYVQSSPLVMSKCMRNMIYYGIQTDNTDIMKEYIDQSIPLLNQRDYPEETAILYRLRGLYAIMEGRTKEAYPLLEKSIDILEGYDSNIAVYSLNIAAAFNYMGEAKRKEKNYEEAIKYYHSAITTCEKNNCIVNPTFYTNMALCYYETGHTEKAYELFIAAISLYDSSTVLMKRSIAKSYAAEYYCTKGDFDTAAKYLTEAEYFSALLDSPSEKAIYSNLCHQLKSTYGENLAELI